MALLHEAGKNIRAQRAREEEWKKQWEKEDEMDPQLEEQAKRDNEERKRLSADLVAQTEGLLEDHGADPEADRHMGILGKVRTIFDHPGKELATKLMDAEGERINVRIIPSGMRPMNPKKSSITIHVQGISSYLLIPEDRNEPLTLGNSDHTLATAEDLMRYKEVVDGVRKKVGYPASLSKLSQGQKS